MIEFLDMRVQREEPTQDFIRANEPPLTNIKDWPTVRFDKRQHLCEAAYFKYNLSRRAGKAEAILKTEYAAPLMRRIMGTFGVNHPGISIVMAFKNGRCAAYLCIDRLPDNGQANLGTGEGWQDGKAFVDAMDSLALVANVPCSVIFSLDSWVPGDDYDIDLTWYEVPWPLARTLGALDSRRTTELRELVVFKQGSDIDDLPCDENEDECSHLDDCCPTDAGE